MSGESLRLVATTSYSATADSSEPLTPARFGHGRRWTDGVHAPRTNEPKLWEFRATARLDQLLAGIVDATSVASARGTVTGWKRIVQGFSKAA